MVTYVHAYEGRWLHEQSLHASDASLGRVHHGCKPHLDQTGARLVSPEEVASLTAEALTSLLADAWDEGAEVMAAQEGILPDLELNPYRSKS